MAKIIPAPNVTKLKQKRLERELTLEQLERLTGISAQQLNRLELPKGHKNHRRFNDDNLQEISQALDCSPSDLLEDGRKRNTASKNHFNKNAGKLFPVSMVPVIAMVPGKWRGHMEEEKSDALIPFIENGRMYDEDKNIRAIQIRGNATNLKAADGDLVYIDISQTDPSKLSGKLVWAECDGISIFRRYRANPDRFEPCSDDPSHESIRPYGEWKILGAAIGVYLIFEKNRETAE